MSTALTRAQAEALQRLADSPAAQAAALAHQQQQAEQRRTVLETYRTQRAEAERAALEAGRKSNEQQGHTQSAFDAWQQAVNVQRAVDMDRDTADRAVERACNLVAAALAPLGGNRITHAAERVGFAIRQAAGSFEWRHSQDRAGKSVAALKDDALPNKLERLQALRMELEALRLADVAPHEIAARCTEIESWLDAGAPERVTAESRAAGLDLVQRVYSEITRRRTARA